MHEALFQKLKNGVGNSIILYALEVSTMSWTDDGNGNYSKPSAKIKINNRQAIRSDIMFKDYQDERYRVQAQGERHVTIRIVAGALAGAFVIGSLIWSICYYNVEALKVPISVSHTDVHNTQVDRGGSGN
jgi:hypothetical protein